jgi:esterase/lipase superfamily enzyme
MKEAAAMLRRYERWYSPALGRDMELLHFGWSGFPVVLFPTSMGRFFQYEDMGLVASLGSKLERGEMQLVCVDSVDAESWYDEAIPPAARGRRHEHYDAYLRDEVLPYVRSRAERSDLGVFGCSFGGYHAANFAGRHPQLVTKAVCFSGVYDVRRFLDGYWDETDYFNSPVDFIAGASDERAREIGRVEWILATGEYDSLAADHRHFDAVLGAKGIAHHAELWSGVFGHDWPFWNDAVVRLL